MIARQGNRYSIEGPVTLENVEALIAEGSHFDGESVIVDLAGVTGADSSALSLLLEWMRRYGGNNGGRITFSNVGPNLRSLAELYGVIDLLPVATSE